MWQEGHGPQDSHQELGGPAVRRGQRLLLRIGCAQHNHCGPPAAAGKEGWQQERSQKLTRGVQSRQPVRSPSSAQSQNGAARPAPSLQGTWNPAGRTGTFPGSLLRRKRVG